MKIRAIVLASVLALAAGVVVAQQTSNFDAETMGAWTPPTAGEPDWGLYNWGSPKGTVYITNAYYRSSPYSMCKLRATGEAAPGTRWNCAMAGTTNVLTYWVLSTDVNQSDTFYAYTGANRSGTLLFVIWLQAGYIKLEGNAGKNNVAAISNGTWYKVTAAVDFDADEVMLVVRDENGFIAGGPYTDDFMASASTIGSITSYEGGTTVPRFFYDDFATLVHDPTPNVSTFDAQDTTTNWVPDGTGLSEFWTRSGTPDQNSRLAVSDTIYHGTGGKAMGQVRFSPGAAPQPRWSCDLNSSNDYASFWYMQTNIVSGAGSDWMIRNGGTYLVYYRLQPADPDALRMKAGDGDIILLGQNQMLANTWYHLETQMDFGTDQARCRLTKEGDAYGAWTD